MAIGAVAAVAIVYGVRHAARAQGAAWPPPVSQAPEGGAPLSPADEAKTMVLPPGYHVQLVASEPTVVDPRFPVNDVVLYADSASVSPAPIRAGQTTVAPTIKATLADWAPGHMEVSLEGRSDTTTYLLVSENWYPDWHVEVDGKPATLLRGDHTLLSVALPSGAREVRFYFASATSARGRLITILALVLAAVLCAAPFWQRRIARG